MIADSDALDDEEYLLTVVQVIADHSSPHDLLDAYATFINRVRSYSSRLESCDASLPALCPLKAHKDTLVAALRRDIRLAHVDPFSSFESEIALKLDARQYARDSSSLCHHALCVVTTIFRFPALYSLLPEDDLALLFGDVLDVALADQLPVLNGEKTYSLSLWALCCNYLPQVVLSPRSHDVFRALQRCLSRERQPTNIVLDGLKALSHTIEHYPSIFLDLLFPLLPHVIANLRCECPERQLHASMILGKFANALVHQTELSLTRWKTLSEHIIPALESICDESHEISTFSSIARTLFSAESCTCTTDTPTLILAVLASWIILCGPTLYSKPTILRFIFRTLAITLVHKEPFVRALHPHVWRCFVWTFSQMLHSTIHSTSIPSVCSLIKQEVRGGIGTALIHALLSDKVSAIERADRVSLTLSVIRAMVRTECRYTRQEAFELLQALTNDVQVEQISQDLDEMPASALFNGAIIGAERSNLPSVIRSIPKVSVSMHPLEETEIAQHYKALLVTWKHFALKVDRKDLASDLLGAWWSILYAYSHQIEREPQITAVTDVLIHTATIIVEFLPSLAMRESHPDWGSWDVHSQLHNLTFVQQLWSAMQKAFLPLDLADSAALILASLLKHAFHVLDLGVRTLWSKLCANLMTTASPSFLRDMQGTTTSQLVICNQRELWGVTAASLSSSNPGLDWNEIVKFLAIPTCSWVLSSSELQAWEALLRGAVALSGDSVAVTERVVQHFRGMKVETWGSIIAVLHLLLVCIHEHGNLPTDGLLSVIDICLTVSYDRACSPDSLTQSLELLVVIRHVIASVPGEVMRVLQGLCGSLCLWIEDHAEVMSDEQFNSVAVTLYCEALKGLEGLPLSIETLGDLETFLASGFCRIPTPAIAPFAFEKFWRATYHGQSQFRDTLPPKIKSCLTGFVAAFGGDLADGLLLATESQSQSINDDFQATSRQQESGELSSWFTFSSTSACAGAIDTDMALHGHRYSDQGDTAFLLQSPYDPQLTVLRQLREYASQTDKTCLDGLEQSTSNPRLLLSPLQDATQGSHSVETNWPIPLQVAKRKRADSDIIPRKRSRTSRDMLRSLRKVESEPATRDVTPVNSTQSSFPPKKRMLFDGVQVPFLHELSHRKTGQRASTGTSKNTLHGHMSSSVERKSMTPPSDDDLDWENMCIVETSSEADVDQYLETSYPSSPLTRTSAHGLDSVSYLPTGLSLPRGMSPSESSPTHDGPPLQRPKTTSARLDALRDVYSSIANGASQIPTSELLLATRLVHQIGAVLTEQMGKKMGYSR